MIWLLFGLALVLYVGCLLYLPRILMLKKFYPAYSSLTFPLAISGIATITMYNYFKGIGNDMPLLEYLGWFQTAMCVIFVLYVLVRYVHHFLIKNLMVRAVTKQTERSEV
jgi:tellurite resistance protein TehA-like permease